MGQAQTSPDFSSPARHDVLAAFKIGDGEIVN